MPCAPMSSGIDELRVAMSEAKHWYWLVVDDNKNCSNEMLYVPGACLQLCDPQISDLLCCTLRHRIPAASGTIRASSNGFGSQNDSYS